MFQLLFQLKNENFGPRTYRTEFMFVSPRSCCCWTNVMRSYVVTTVKRRRKQNASTRIEWADRVFECPLWGTSDSPGEDFLFFTQVDDVVFIISISVIIVTA